MHQFQQARIHRHLWQKTNWQTYLVKQLLGEKFSFYMTGVYQCSKNEMLAYFSEQLALYSGKKQARPKNWFEAFSQLRTYLSTLLEEREQIIIFIDELPWLDTPKSNFIRALDLFWNGWASDQPNIKFIVCGSATTWMTNKLLGDKGGLHNRVTRKIYLAPFDLNETELFLQSKGIVWTPSDSRMLHDYGRHAILPQYGRQAI